MVSNSVRDPWIQSTCSATLGCSVETCETNTNDDFNTALLPCAVNDGEIFKRFDLLVKWHIAWMGIFELTIRHNTKCRHIFWFWNSIPAKFDASIHFCLFNNKLNRLWYVCLFQTAVYIAKATTAYLTAAVIRLCLYFYALDHATVARAGEQYIVIPFVARLLSSML